MPYCATATYCTNKGERRDIVYLRDSGSLQALASKECFSEDNYFDTSKHWLIHGIFGIPTELFLFEIDFQYDKLQGKILCELIDSLPYGVDILVGNDLDGIMHLTVSVVTCAGTGTSNTQNVVRPEKTNVKELGSDHDDTDDIDDVLEDNHADENDVNDWDDVGVTNNVVNTNRSALVDQNDNLALDLDRLFMYYISPILPND